MKTENEILAELKEEIEKQRELIEKLGQSIISMMSTLLSGKDDHAIDEYIEKLKK